MEAALMMVLIIAAIPTYFWWQGEIEVYPPEFKHLWLIPLAFAPWLVSQVVTYPILARFVANQVIILGFLIVNRHVRGVHWVIAGLICNAIPTLTHGGLMPVSAELMPRIYDGEWQLYHRVGWSIVLPPDKIRFWWLTDIVLVEPLRKAYSLGDVLVVVGVILMIAYSALPPEPRLGRVNVAE